MTAMSIWAESGINYDGTTLEMNTDFTRSQSGTFYKSVMKEVSGMAASRTTAGYLWAHNDENLGDEKSRCFSAQELLDLGLNFDQCKFPKEEEEVLRPEELLKQYHEKRTALDAKIDQTLSEIQQMLGIEIK